MEELNKTQVVLLTLFITFVTSVTTGIVTVTLLQQAPPGVTQTINRVVERTIEKITPVTTKTEVTTRVVAQEDQIIQVAAALKPAIARIVLPSATVAVENSATTSTDQLAAIALVNSNVDEDVGTGFLVSSDGLVVTASALLYSEATDYEVYVGDKKYPANLISNNTSSGLAVLRIIHDKSVKFLAPPFASSAVKLGQTVIVLGRDLSRYTVSVGLVASVKEAVPPALPSFKTTVKSDGTNIGGPLLSSDGYVIGVNLEGGNALPIELVRAYLGAMASTTKSTI